MSAVYFYRKHLTLETRLLIQATHPSCYLLGAVRLWTTISEECRASRAKTTALRRTAARTVDPAGGVE